MENHPKPQRYDIHVRGLLSDTLLSAFPELRARMRKHETVLSGALPDRAALHGVLSRIEALGLDLLEVRRARSGGTAPPEADGPTEAAVEQSVGSDDGASFRARRR